MLSLLLVDDEYLVRKGLRETIDWSALGIERIEEACDGAEGLEKALGIQPDIIITDIYMPVMDGMEFISNLKNRCVSSEIIILSGYGEFSFAKDAIKNGAAAYILKPVDESELIETVKNIINKINESRALKEYHETLKNEFSSMQAYFIESLLKTDKISSELFHEKKKFFQLDLYDTHFCVILIQVTKGVTHELHALIDYTHDGLKMVSHLDSSNISILLSIGETGGIMKHIDTFCRRLVETATSIGCVITVGISRVSDGIENIHKLYEEALSVADYRKNLEVSSIVATEEFYYQSARKEIKDAIRYIHENYKENITVMTLADLVYMSQSNFMHVFREEIGCTFNEYLTKTRIEVAKSLFKSGRYRVYEVSVMVGYTDVKYFSQIFKKTTGYSPSEYARLE